MAVIVTLSAFAALVFALALFENRRGAHRLGVVKARLKSSNMELDPRKLLPTEPAEDENVATAFLELIPSLRTFELPDGVPPPKAMQMIAPGEAVSSIRRSAASRLHGAEYAWERLRPVEAEAYRHLTNLSAVAARSRFLTSIDISKGLADVELKALAGLPPASRVLRTTALLCLANGDDRRAAEAVITLLNLFSNKSEDPFVIAEMVRMSHARTAFSLTWELLQHATLPDQTWQRLQSAWERCRFLEHHEKVWRMELAAMADTFERLKSSGAYRRHILDNFATIEKDIGLTWGAPTRGFLLHHLHAPLWRVLWADQDFAYNIETHEKEVRLGIVGQSNNWTLVRGEAARLGRTNETALAFNLFEAEREEVSLYDRFRYLISNGPSAVRGSHILRTFQSETEARLAATAIALRRYKLASESHPPNLQALVPRFLKSIPIDPMDGKPLKYSTAVETYQLYSSGLNGQDDLGDPDPSNEADGNVTTIWDGKDAIWPASQVRIRDRLGAFCLLLEVSSRPRQFR